MKKGIFIRRLAMAAVVLSAAIGSFMPTTAAAAPGQPIGAPIEVTGQMVDTLAIARAADGRFVVVTSEYCDAPLPCTQQLMARRYSASGELLGTPINIATAIGANGFSYDDTHVAMNADGNFAVTWMQVHLQSRAEDLLSPYGPLSLHLQSFSADGSPLSGDITVARDLLPSKLSGNAVAIDDAGNVVVSVGRGTYRTFLVTRNGLSPLLITETESIVVHRYAADGDELMRPVGVVSGLSLKKYGSTIYFSKGNTLRGLSVACDGPGNFVVGWVDGGVKLRRYAATGVAQGPAETIDGSGEAEGAVALAMNRAGRLSVLWPVYGGSYVQSFLPGGAGDGGATAIAGGGGLNISIDAVGDLALAQGFRGSDSAGVNVRSLMPDGALRYAPYGIVLPPVSSIVAAGVASDAAGNYAVAYSYFVPFYDRDQYPSKTYVQLFEGP